VARAFYSVVQYCPDRLRAEAVNVGLVLLCVEPHEVRVRVTTNHERVRKLFSIAKPELKNLKLSTQSLANRITLSRDELRTEQDFASFVASRANDLRLTEPRLAKLEEIDSCFERLYSQLVERCSTEVLAEASPAEVLPPQLGEVFYRLQQSHKIWQPGTITVPVYKRKIDIPYAFRNGVVNLVKPKVFAEDKRAETQAAKLAVDGQLIAKHPINGEMHKLIVISTHESPKQEKEITEHVAPMFRELGVRLVRPQEAEAFAREVEASAH
jgi:hypothetical protein